MTQQSLSDFHFWKLSTVNWRNWRQKSAFEKLNNWILNKLNRNCYCNYCNAIMEISLHYTTPSKRCALRFSARIFVATCGDKIFLVWEEKFIDHCHFVLAIRSRPLRRWTWTVEHSIFEKYLHCCGTPEIPLKAGINKNNCYY